MSDKEVDEELVKHFEDSMCLGKDNIISKEFVIPPSLVELESPFTWRVDYRCDARDIVDRIEQKLGEMGDDDDDLIQWKLFVLNLILCYEYTKNGNIEDAEEKQMILDTILDERRINEGKLSGPVMGSGLRHISLACKCFLLHASQLHDEMNNTLTLIVPFEDLKTKDKASALCIKGAYFSEFGYSGISDSIGMFEKALGMDNNCGEWYFLLGRSLSRLRRLEKRSAIPDQRELKALERAVELSKYVSFMVLLAQSYRETARNLFIEKKRDLKLFKHYCDSLNQKSLDLYKKVLSENKINVHVLVRCALGFMKLPNPWKELDNAKICILKALDLAPQNPMANHVAGTYYTSVKNYKQAMEYLSKACTYGVFGAEIDLIVLKKKQIEAYDPAADLERLLTIYKEKPHQESLLCYLGAYYYFSKNSFKKAFTYWSQVVEMNINSEKLKIHYNAIEDQRPVNINKIIILEIMKLLNAEDITQSERILYDQTISKFIENHPGLITAITEIDVSLYKNRSFEYKSWKDGSIDKKYNSGNSVPNHPLKRNNHSGRKDQSNTASSYKSSFFSTVGCSQPHGSASEAPERARASSRGRERGGGRGSERGRGRGRGRSGSGEGGSGGGSGNGAKTSHFSWRVEQQPVSGNSKGSTGSGKSHPQATKSASSSWRNRGPQ